MYAWLGDSVAAGATIVTASRRLARELRRHYDDSQLAAGSKAWLTPPIYYQGDWLRRLADSAQDGVGRTLWLDAHAQSLLWEQLVARHAGDRLIGVGGVVRHAVQSWRMVNDWQIAVGELSRSARTQDERLFARVAADYRQTLVRRGWTDDSGTIVLVGALASAGSFPLPESVVYAGYDRPPPAVAALFRILLEVGCTVSEAPEARCGGGRRIAAYADTEAELRAAGNWARECLEVSPDARVGIVCSGLEADAERAARLVREGLAPGWQLGGPAWRAAVNVSYGRRLSEFPAIHISLLLLRWTCGALDSRDVSLLLRSRLLDGREAGGRSRLELHLRDIPEREWRPAALLEVLQPDEDNADAVAWARALRRIADFAPGTAQTATPAEWAAAIDGLLRDVGWPGAGTLDSGAYQLVNRWRELLNELARLAPVAPQMSLDECVRRLHTMSGETVFQPQSEAGLVQLLGPLEAAGMQFDHLWVSGLDVRHWPPPASPSPFLSRSLQRQYGMPDSTPDDTLDFARRVLARLVDSAPEVALSWVRTDQDVELAPSPLLDQLGAEAGVATADPHWFAGVLCSGEATTPVRDDPAPPVAIGEELAGGAYTVHRQANEPLAAFAYGRLRVRDVEPFVPGLSARLRGSLIHRVLHRLYADAPTRDEIRKWRPEEVAERLGQAIDAGLGRDRRVADRRQQRLLSLEKVRLERMLGMFLSAERQRGEFAVEAVERHMTLRRHGVVLELRADRLDRLPDNSLLIVDYKTGATKNLLNRDGEPASLQLVVYSCAVDGPVGGLALFNVDSRAIVYKGAGAGWDSPCGGDWQDRLANWQSLVDAAIGELAHGDVRVNVKQSAEEGRALGLLSRLEGLRHGR